MPTRTTEDILKDADEVAEGQDGGYYYLCGHPVEKLIAELSAKLIEREGVLREIVDYLDSNVLNQICATSILHKKAKQALQQTEED